MEFSNSVNVADKIAAGRKVLESIVTDTLAHKLDIGNERAISNRLRRVTHLIAWTYKYWKYSLRESHKNKLDRPIALDNSLIVDLAIDVVNSLCYANSVYKIPDSIAAELVEISMEYLEASFQIDSNYDCLRNRSLTNILFAICSRSQAAQNSTEYWLKLIEHSKQDEFLEEDMTACMNMIGPAVETARQILHGEIDDKIDFYYSSNEFLLNYTKYHEEWQEATNQEITNLVEEIYFNDPAAEGDYLDDTENLTKFFLNDLPSSASSFMKDLLIAINIELHEDIPEMENHSLWLFMEGLVPISPGEFASQMSRLLEIRQEIEKQRYLGPQI
jgi:hypothetical protein